ncbi:XdhC family protein [Pseudoroseicyclus tamaricis]|uniref:XdhC family protein n=1 Tax=Pseudoroseicyclus tamaricis TaxID=2705421 RepID=A0A6B2JZD3_9RHOB|nr:XdhC family protein [Pseudoroseicyclus tamaricis]NDV00732.1 XdhC family protein [Pseudoroseicyclus tamaricis]
MDNIAATALDWHRAGQGAVLATVMESWSSAPTRAGATMAVSGSGETCGALAGGSVEADVVPAALAALSAGEARTLSLQVSDERARAARLACGGSIRVLLQPVGSALPEPLLAKLAAATTDRRPVALVTPPEGAPRLATPEDFPERFRTGRSGAEKETGAFVALHVPPLRLIVVGAGQIAEALVPMARACDMAPLVLDPRPGFAAAFHAAPASADPVEEAIAAAAPDARTAVVTLTHDHPVDDAGLRAALASPAFYIGALGSRRTHAARLERLAAAGIPGDTAARIHAPVGLDIGAVTPAEIAASILAQMIAALRRP